MKKGGRAAFLPTMNCEKSYICALTGSGCNGTMSSFRFSLLYSSQSCISASNEAVGDEWMEGREMGCDAMCGPKTCFSSRSSRVWIFSSCEEAFETCDTDPGSTWSMQISDDVIAGLKTKSYASYCLLSCFRRCVSGDCCCDAAVRFSFDNYNQFKHQQDYHFLLSASSTATLSRIAHDTVVMTTVGLHALKSPVATTETAASTVIETCSPAQAYPR